MTTPIGTISASDISTELGRTAGAAFSMDDSGVRQLAGITGAGTTISFNVLRGKSAYTAMSGSLGNVEMFGMAGNTGAMYNETESLTISLSGGAAPYTFTWSKVSGSGSVDAVNSASTVVRMPVQRFGTEGDVSTQVVQCVVTDGKGNTLTRQCTVTMTLY